MFEEAVVGRRQCVVENNTVGQSGKAAQLIEGAEYIQICGGPCIVCITPLLYQLYLFQCLYYRSPLRQLLLRSRHGVIPGQGWLL